MRFAILSLPMIATLFMAHAALAHGNGSTDISIPPPEPIYEVNPGERAGYILSPGYWQWNGSKHGWMTSRWIKNREGYVWMPDQWEQHGDKWHLAPGHWVEDENYEDQPMELADVAPVAPTPQSHGQKEGYYKTYPKNQLYRPH